MVPAPGGQFRIPGSDFFPDVRFDYVSMDIQFDDGNDIPGIPEDNFGQTELEARWNFQSRWTLVGFTRTGKAEDAFGDLFESCEDLRHTYGAGASYLIARSLVIQAGSS